MVSKRTKAATKRARSKRTKRAKQADAEVKRVTVARHIVAKTRESMNKRLYSDAEKLMYMMYETYLNDLGAVIFSVHGTDDEERAHGMESFAPGHITAYIVNNPGIEFEIAMSYEDINQTIRVWTTEEWMQEFYMPGGMMGGRLYKRSQDMLIPTLDGIEARIFTTARLSTRVLFSGPAHGKPVIFLHGNLTSATFWEETMLAMPDGYRCIAPDQRGFGEADPAAVVDGENGLGDMAEDVIALMNRLNIEEAHVVGHSMGGGVVWRLLRDVPFYLRSASLIAPVSPFGFGGTKDADGTLCAPDAAGSGGGVANPQYTQLLRDGERGDGEMSPRAVMNGFYWKPPFTSSREEDLLLSVLATHTDERDYPGDSNASEHFPFVAPGRWGVLNAMAPNNQPDFDRLCENDEKPPILWLRGDSDQVIADESMFDLATFGKLGVIPGYPGEDVCPPQPMIQQIAAVLDKRREAGGRVDEVLLEDCGHTPFIEKAEEFNQALHAFLASV